MNTIEKDLLLKDLSARLPYGVKILTNQSKICATLLRGGKYEDGNEYFIATKIGCALKVDEFKPYLRPMSSMTIAEKEEYQYITERWMNDPNYSISDSTDWLNMKMIDYRGLIPMGLALSAPKGMYKEGGEE